VTRDGRTEAEILGEMLRLSDRLLRTADPLMAGQYRHLHDRIRALMEVRAPEAEVPPP
jgi:hypothetical protein